MFESGGKTVNARKRERYVPQACNRCRIAKVRCNGKSPCSYCTARDPQSCNYEFSQFPREQHTGINPNEQEDLKSLLQQQSDKLDTILRHVSNLDKIRSLQGSRSRGPWSAYGEHETPLPLIRSSTSAFFCIHMIDTNLGVDSERLQTPGSSTQSQSSSFSILHDQIVNGGASDIGEWDGETAGRDLSGVTTVGDGPLKVSTHALDSLSRSEIIRLIQKYQDIAGMMYPMMDPTHLEQLVNKAGDSYSADERVTGIQPLVKKIDISTLEIVVAIALTDEGETDIELMQALHDDVLPDVQYMMWNTRVNLQGLVLLTLVSIYYYYSHKWRIAWRFIGNVARVILELGLNRQVVLDWSFPDRTAHTQALNTVWTVFILELQLRYALGLSTTVQDLVLDPAFPKPIEAPYLEAMIYYARIGAQVCEAMSCDGPATQMIPQNYQDAYNYFKHRLSEWQKAIKAKFQFRATDDRTDRWNRHLDLVLRLRANNLHIVVARFVLFGKGTRGIALADVWSTCIDAAADTTCILGTIDESPTTIRVTQSEANHFLTSSIGISILTLLQGSLFSMSIQSVVDQTTNLRAQQSTILCLNLLRNRAEASYQTKHLWERINDLACRLNLLGFLGPLTIPSPEDGADTIETTGVGEMRDSSTRLLDDQLLASLSPRTLDPRISSCRDGIEAATSVGPTSFSPLEAMLDPVYMFQGVED